MKVQSKNVTLFMDNASAYPEFNWKIQQHQNCVSPQTRDFTHVTVGCWHNKEFQSEVQKVVHALRASWNC